jgi:magnesium-transporting ATPase (P-type)
VKKERLTKENFLHNPNPFLFASSIIKGGNCKALVCAVGDNTFIGKRNDRVTIEDFPTAT